MPTLTITKTYLNGNILTQTDLDNAFNSVSTLLNTTLLDSANIQTGGIIGANLANATITATQIAAGAVGTAQLASSAVSTAIIAAGAVTQATRAALGQQISATSGTFALSSNNSVFTDVTNLSVTIATTGRPVFLGLINDSGGISSQIEVTIGGSSNAVGGQMRFLRGATEISNLQFYYVVGGSVSSGLDMMFTPLPWHIDVPASSAYTYKVQIACRDTLTTFNCNRVKLVAFEL